MRAPPGGDRSSAQRVVDIPPRFLDRAGRTEEDRPAEGEGDAGTFRGVGHHEWAFRKKMESGPAFAGHGEGDEKEWV
jgi:hypothetical protein